MYSVEIDKYMYDVQQSSNETDVLECDVATLQPA